MTDYIAAGGSPSGDPSRERDFVIDVRNADGVLTARYTLYGVPDLKLVYDLPVTLLETGEATLVIRGIKNTPPYDEVDSDVAFPSNQDGETTPEFLITAEEVKRLDELGTDIKGRAVDAMRGHGFIIEGNRLRPADESESEWAREYEAMEGPEENIPADVRKANLVNKQRIEDAEIHE